MQIYTHPHMPNNPSRATESCTQVHEPLSYSPHISFQMLSLTFSPGTLLYIICLLHLTLAIPTPPSCFWQQITMIVWCLSTPSNIVLPCSTEWAAVPRSVSLWWSGWTPAVGTVQGNPPPRPSWKTHTSFPSSLRHLGSAGRNEEIMTEREFPRREAFKEMRGYFFLHFRKHITNFVKHKKTLVQL